jgi:hypothetical protein
MKYMKSFFLLCIITFLLPLNSNAQLEGGINGVSLTGDTLLAMREKYSSKKKFNEYCMYRYIASKGFSPMPIFHPVSLLKKMFNIPKKDRLKMYPFNKYDSISIYSLYDNKTIILDTFLKYKLSNLIFNYSYKGIITEAYNFTNFEDEVKISILFCNTHNSACKYINYYISGICDTNFTDFELSQLDLDRTKIEFFIEQLNIK